MRESRSILVPAVLAAALLGQGTSAVAAQAAPVPPSTRMATRAELTASAEHYDRLASSPAYGERSRSRARAMAEAARRRLAQGDFQVGDRILLAITGTVPFSDTLTVLEGPRLAVPNYGNVALAGVLRVELEAKLLRDLRVVVLNTSLTARPLMRIAVFGQVGSPGFYSAPQEATLDQILTRAGGPSVAAAASAIRVVRSDTTLYDAHEVRSAIASGSTVEMLGLQDGDVLDVPAAPLPWDRGMVLQIVSLVVMPILTVMLVQP